MLVKYVTTSASTIAQVINDLMRLACGESIVNLSASCDKTNSAVVANTVAPGWSLVDSTGPNSSTVISAPDAGGTYTKYFGLEPSSGYLGSISCCFKIG